MNKQQMLDILNELKVELAENQQLDTHQKQTTEALIEEIWAQVSAPENQLSGDQYLLNKFKNVTEEFEINHPKLTDIFGRLSDLLSRMGL
ncbi:DUF4404 family protein [Aliikangiella marina]|uniref:DUF4404 family protein n=1 Tax=Aliikangiella marina TaxID=1712262 RepID=A0A545TD63_9GAMM|nr:DUF4404 family protein [Aliikangiella marina]TQV75159.1 DUF4404 family protein [Aliikangiella marina]